MYAQTRTYSDHQHHDVLSVAFYSVAEERGVSE